jgi:hypothetical protein
MVTPWITPLPSIAIVPAGLSPSPGEPKLQSTASAQAPTWEAGYGVVFELDSTGNYTVLYRFTGGADGGNPR